MKRNSIFIICAIICLSLSLGYSSSVFGLETSSEDDGPLLGTKSSITALTIGMNYLEHHSNEKFMPTSLPMPLMDPGYFDFGDWAFYANDYFHDMLKPTLNGHADKLFLKPLDFSSRRAPTIEKTLDGNAALVRVEYPRHEELERLLQKLYFNLIRGPVILSVAYSSDDVLDEFPEYKNWQCFTPLKDPSAGEDGDVHIVYVDWDNVHSIVAFLDGGRIRVADNGRIYDVDHNSLIAQANAILAMPDSEIISERGDKLNYLLYVNDQKVALRNN